MPLMTDDNDPSQSNAGASDTRDLHHVLTLRCEFPAEIFEDILFDREHDIDKAASHLKAEYRPRALEGAERTIVRQLIPRNTQLDKSLIQTCHFLPGTIVYIPHVDDPEEMPFYHPKVAELWFNHDAESLSLSYRLFPGVEYSERLQRTGLRLLETIHKHCKGQLAGYEKRVHLDQIIPQKTYQDTYTRMKNKYGKYLVDSWVEVTDPGKHVFEDIAIASFLVELWKTIDVTSFVDIGCGNGVLTYLLISEGYRGSGFDARRRKTWSVFPQEVQDCLTEQVLVPAMFNGGDAYHNGCFEKGTFIVSNHADELTAWTPLLAYMNHSAFIAIPCCSHNLAGARFRAPTGVKEARLPQQQDLIERTGDQPETGSLKKSIAQKGMQSAYSSLCLYVESLATAVGFKVEREVLRIPSTRNLSIIGRQQAQPGDPEVVSKLVEKELGRDLDSIAAEWKERLDKIKKKSAAH